MHLLGGVKVVSSEVTASTSSWMSEYWNGSLCFINYVPWGQKRNLKPSPSFANIVKNNVKKKNTFDRLGKKKQSKKKGIKGTHLRWHWAPRLWRCFLA
jgi:hypothetical protein